jgi:hypothetical protein
MITIKREFKIPTRTKHFPNTITSDNANSNANQLINQLICITNNECLILHQQRFSRGLYFVQFAHPALREI